MKFYIHMGRKVSTMLRERRIALAKSGKTKKQINSFNDLELDEKIKELRGRIINCKYDLAKNSHNKIIKQKLEYLRSELEKLEEKRDAAPKI